MDKKIYSRKSITENPMELMYSTLLFSRAHEESATKSKRTYGNALSIIEKYNNGERSVDGYAIAIKSVGTNIWWYDYTISLSPNLAINIRRILIKCRPKSRYNFVMFLVRSRLILNKLRLTL
jgi:hypothetical protein